MMFQPDEINKMSAILQYCSSDQHSLIRSMDHLIQTEENDQRSDVLNTLKKALLLSWGDNQKNKEMLAALPVLTKITHRKSREITPGASLTKKCTFSGTGHYDFFLIENTFDHKRRLFARKTDMNRRIVAERLQSVPVCFGEYAAYLCEYSLDSEKEYLTVMTMLENQWAIFT
ncbi:hypothetical protein [Paenibacillus bovis]|uniref:Uncharacterized protein n=1 Tax=Paenibacillus bovis TaxID=1616788 RepID=A0A1X9T442_9BACL|nr:hypothetical protein [Paenibacillus bovis]ARR10708.1 hypothetical protein AR543_p0100 [Paenibacillus bovis]